MNCGLTNLDTLKKHLLAGTMKTDPRFDAIIADIGKGVAAQFDDQANRLFTYKAADTYTVSADRAHIYVPRYPFISPITQVEIKNDEATGWVVQPLTVILNTNPESGLVFLGAATGSYWSQLRITYTGGYWFETAEPDDAAYPTATPAGATALPENLKLAFLLQCRHVWRAIDKLGTSILEKPETVATDAGTQSLVPQVAETLRSLTRYAMT
jgi:hypothetical protein